MATQTNNYRGLVQKFHKGVDYVLIYLDSKVSKEKRERSHREKPGRELGLGVTSRNNLDYLQFCYRLS